MGEKKTSLLNESPFQGGLPGKSCKGKKSRGDGSGGGWLVFDLMENFSFVYSIIKT